MPDDSPDSGFSILSGGIELLDRVQPLWLQLRRYHADLAPRWAAEFLAKTFDERRADLLAKANDGLLVVLASVRGGDIGYCVSTIAPKAEAEVDSLFVRPGHRGRGVGHALMTATMRWFEVRSVRSISVDVISGNDAAQGFYARFGFAQRTVRLSLVRNESKRAWPSQRIERAPDEWLEVLLQEKVNAKLDNPPDTETVDANF